MILKLFPTKRENCLPVNDMSIIQLYVSLTLQKVIFSGKLSGTSLVQINYLATHLNPKMKWLVMCTWEKKSQHLDKGTQNNAKMDLFQFV